MAKGRIFGARPTRPPLSDEERRRRKRDWLLAAAAAVVLAAAQFISMRLSRLPDALPFANSFTFLLLNVFSVGLIAGLSYLVIRQLAKLALEHRSGVFGTHTGFRLVASLLLAAALPAGALYWVSSGFIKDSIDSWFTLQIDQAIEQSRSIADAAYEEWGAHALHFGEQLSTQITGQGLLAEDKREALTEFLREKQREYHLGVVQVFPLSGGEAPATLINPDIPSAVFAARESPIVTSALAGERVSQVPDTGAGIGDVIRGAVPILSSDPERPEEIVGALVVNRLVPHPLALRVDNLHVARDEYNIFKSASEDIAGAYQLALLLVAATFVLLAVWWGLRMARDITERVRALAEGAKQVARGDLDLALQDERQDEIGLLVRSFNRMTGDLRETRRNLVRTNAEMDERRRYMEIVLRNVDAGVVSRDADGRVVTINFSALRMLGIDVGASVIGGKLEEFIDHPELLEALGELAADVRPGLRESARRRVQIAGPAGAALNLVVTLSLLQDEEGARRGSVIVLADYTQEVRAQRMAAWREVARRIAHEIKNPLTPIQLSAQRLRRRFRREIRGEEDGRVFDESVDTIIGHVDGLKVLVNEFSQFARLPRANPRLDDLNALVRETVSSYAGLEGIVLAVEADPQLPRAPIDRDQVRRVLTNLIDNAVAVCEGKGRITLRTGYDAALQIVRLTVEDDGPGIPLHYRSRIFEPYFSARKNGTGLGLAIVARIVAEHYGYLRVESNTPRGARLVIELPLRPPAGDPSTEVAGHQAGPAA